MMIMTFAGIHFDQAVPFPLCVCLCVQYVLCVCTCLHMHVCIRAQVRLCALFDKLLY